MGQRLMGPDGKPRVVLKLCRGVDEMFVVRPTKGEPWVVNGDHVLTLQRVREGSTSKKCIDRAYELVDVSVREWMGWSNRRKHIHKIIRAGVRRFIPETKPGFDPYILGVMLGDGHSVSEGRSVMFTTADREIAGAMRVLARQWSLRLVEAAERGHAKTYRVVGHRGLPNKLLNYFRALGCMDSCATKFVPESFKRGSFRDRLALVAGLLDTDGSLSVGGYDFISKSPRLAQDVAFLARSVGLAAYVRKCVKRATNSPGHEGSLYWRVSISGDVSIVPCRVRRKRAEIRMQKKNVLRTGFTVEPFGVGEFFGFTLSGDGRYLLDDFTITHNSGKSSMALAFVTMVKTPTLVIVPNGALFDDWVSRCTDPKELGLKSRDVGIIRGKERSFKPITIAVQRTLAVHGVDAQMRSIFGCVIEDEVQQAPAATFFGAIDPFPAKYRIGISANEGRKDQKECLTYDLFGPPIIDIEQKEVDRVGATMPVEVVCVPSKFRAPWYRRDNRASVDFEEMANPKMSSIGSADEGNEFDRLLREMAADDRREEQIVDLVVRKAREGRQVLVFCRRVAHVQKLEQRIAAHGVATGLLLGGAGELERVRRATTAGIRDGSVRVAVGTIECMGTGNDLPSVEVGVLTFPLHTNKFLFRQVRGRICRASRATGKEIAELHCICDPEVYPGQVKAYARANGGKVETPR